MLFICYPDNNNVFIIITKTIVILYFLWAKNKKQVIKNKMIIYFRFNDGYPNISFLSSSIIQIEFSATV